MQGMDWVYAWFFPVVWAVYLIYWQIAAAGAKANERIESVGSRIFRTVLLLAGVLLMSWPLIQLANSGLKGVDPFGARSVLWSCGRGRL